MVRGQNGALLARHVCCAALQCSSLFLELWRLAHCADRSWTTKVVFQNAAQRQLGFFIDIPRIVRMDDRAPKRFFQSNWNVDVSQTTVGHSGPCRSARIAEPTSCVGLVGFAPHPPGGTGALLEPCWNPAAIRTCLLLFRGRISGGPGHSQVAAIAGWPPGCGRPELGLAWRTRAERGCTGRPAARDLNYRSCLFFETRRMQGGLHGSGEVGTSKTGKGGKGAGVPWKVLSRHQPPPLTQVPRTHPVLIASI